MALYMVTFDEELIRRVREELERLGEEVRVSRSRVVPEFWRIVVTHSTENVEEFKKKVESVASKILGDLWFKVEVEA